MGRGEAVETPRRRGCTVPCTVVRKWRRPTKVLDGVGRGAHSHAVRDKAPQNYYQTILVNTFVAI